MKIKKSDLAKLISEELNAVRMAIPAWLEEGNYDQLPQAGDPEEEARLKAEQEELERIEAEKLLAKQKR